MKRLKKILAVLIAASALAVAAAPAAKADGWYVSGSYGGSAYWDPACGCWVYPRYAYYPTYTVQPTYTYYSYPRYSYPYYSRPSFSVGFSIGSRSRVYGGYRWWR